MNSTPPASSPPRPPRVVIGHDFMETFGGAERVVREMARVFPDAPVVAILGRRAVARRMGVEDRFQSLLPSRGALLDHYRLLTPVMPAIVDRYRLPEAEVLLTSSYAFAHRFRTVNEAPQLCYCYSPLRFAWSMTDPYRQVWSRGPVSSGAFEALAATMRRADRRAAERVYRYIALSRYTAGQISEVYGREADVIDPPVDTERFQPSSRPPEDYFLFTGRLVEPYKRPTAVIEAFRKLPFRLVVAGDGPELERLRAIASPNVEFVGHLEDDDLVEYMQHCLATIFPSQDDFGLIPVEVAACGRPTIAYAGGGALETVIPGVTGEFMPTQTAQAIVEAVNAFRPERYDSGKIRLHAERWSKERFHVAIRRAVEYVALT